MTDVARGAIRAIATFCRHVTPRGGDATTDLAMARSQPTPSTATPADATPVDATPVVGSPLPSGLAFGMGDSGNPNVAGPARLDSGNPNVAAPARLDRRLQQLKLDDRAMTYTEVESETVLSPVSTSSAASLSAPETTAPPKKSRSRRSSLSSFFKRSEPPSGSSSTDVPPKNHHGPGPGEAGWPGIYAGPDVSDTVLASSVVQFDIR